VAGGEIFKKELIFFFFGATKSVTLYLSRENHLENDYFSHCFGGFTDDQLPIA
jgi:hypothetical protein